MVMCRVTVQSALAFALVHWCRVPWEPVVAALGLSTVPAWLRLAATSGRGGKNRP